MQQKSESKSQEIDPLADPRLVVEKLGVWTVLRERKSRLESTHPRAILSQLHDLYVPCKRLLQDALRLEPFYCAMYFLHKIWSSMEPVILLHYSSSILHAVELSLKNQVPDVRAIGYAVTANLVCVAVTAILRTLAAKIGPRLQSSITAYYEECFLQAGLNRDLPTSQDSERFSHINGDAAWDALVIVTDYLVTIINALAHVLFVSRSPTLTNSSSAFAAVCLVHPATEVLLGESLWHNDMVFFTSNEIYKRMKSLQDLTRREFKKDVLCGDIADYVMKEHTKARELLRGTPTVPVWDLEDELASGWQIPLGLLADLPMVYYALQAILYSHKFSMTTIAILQQSHANLKGIFLRLMSSWTIVRREVGSLKHLYSTIDMKNSIIDGKMTYPPLSDEKSKGMGIELSNVSFAYPGTRTKSNALDDVSVSIAPGSLVVVVGTNGSGKSTLVNALTRLYDVNSGTVLIDGHPIQEYRLADLRNATAVLTQDHQLFPLSLFENIGIGNSVLMGNKDRVMESAKQGGAAEVLEKFKEGIDTVLEPYHSLYSNFNAGAPRDHPLNCAIRALNQKAEVSGGEKQRLVASRMFMRFTSGDIRLVCVDEPSSALDPEAEFKLFNNLRQVREGKTMIFITHRFGHLSRYADLILYMKDGKIAERGTHEELMKENAGYAHHYNIQASAFQASHVSAT